MRKHLDIWSINVIVLTLILFMVALFVKGFTHDMLLEAGIFMVSVKLILMSYKNSIIAQKTDEHLLEIRSLLLNQKN